MSTFATPRNNVATTVGSAYTAGSGSLVVASGAGALFGSPTPTAPIRVAVVTAASYGSSAEVLTYFSATGRTSDTLTGLTAIEGSTDRDYAVGAKVEMRITAAAVSDLNTAVLAIEALGASWVSLQDRGVLSDATLTNGSASFGTDQTAALQAILDLASSGPVAIRWDRAVSHTGLRYRSNTTIQGLPGCGWILRSNSDVPGMRNFNLTLNSYGTPDRNIIIRDLICNGNGGTIAAHNQAHDGAQGWCVGIAAFGVEDMSIEGCQVINARTYGVHAGGFKRLRIHRCFVDDGITGVEANHDGFHFNGPWQGGELVDCEASCRDDHFSLCTNDGVVGVGSAYPSTGGAGRDFAVRNFTIRGGGAGFRLLSRADAMTGTSIRGVHGDCIGYVGILDNFDDEGGAVAEGAFRSATIEDIDVVITGAGIPAMFRVGGVWDQLRFLNVVKNRHTYEMGILQLDNSLLCQLLELDFRVYDHTGTLASAMVQADAGQVASLIVNGKVNRRAPFPRTTATPLRINGATIGQAVVTGQYRGVKQVVDLNAGRLNHLKVDLIQTEEGSAGGALKIASGLTLPVYERHGIFADDVTSDSAGTVTASRGSWVASTPADAVVGLQHQSEFASGGSTALNLYTPEVGSAWTVQSGTAPTVTGGAASYASGTAPIQTTDAFVADGVVLFGFNTTGGTAGEGVALNIGWTDTNNRTIINFNVDTIKYYSDIGGSVVEQASHPTTIANGVDHEVIVVRSGTSYAVTIDGVTKATVTIPGNTTATRHGWGWYGAVTGSLVNHYRFYR